MLFFIYASTICGGLFAVFSAVFRRCMPSVKSVFACGVFCGYAIIILSETLLLRNLTPYGFYELSPIASYIRAARAPSHLARIEIRNLILNVLMFIPLGVLLPVMFQRLRKFYTAMPIALSATFFIETAQLITGRGVFSTEDILHNFFGAIVGYSFYKLISKIYIKRKCNDEHSNFRQGTLL